MRSVDLRARIVLPAPIVLVHRLPVRPERIALGHLVRIAHVRQVCIVPQLAPIVPGRVRRATLGVPAAQSQQVLRLASSRPQPPLRGRARRPRLVFAGITLTGRNGRASGTLVRRLDPEIENQEGAVIAPFVLVG